MRHSLRVASLALSLMVACGEDRRGSERSGEVPGEPAATGGEGEGERGEGAGGDVEPGEGEGEGEGAGEGEGGGEGAGEGEGEGEGEGAGEGEGEGAGEGEGEGEGEGQGAPPTPCQGLRFCDGFESDRAGAAPNPDGWSLVSPNCSGDGRVLVEDGLAHRGRRSLRVEGSGGYCNHIFASPRVGIDDLAPTLHGRFWVRFEQALGMQHITFATLHDGAQDKDLRMGGQSGVLMWNREIDDATLPELSPTGISLSVAPVPGAWTCIEFAIDQTDGTIATWVDGEAIVGLTQDGVPTPDVDAQWLRMPDWAPDLTSVGFGWESYGDAPAALWFDDVALGSVRIGCGD